MIKLVSLLKEISQTPDIKVGNPAYYQQLVDQSNNVSTSQRKYFKDIIDSIKSQGNLATSRQFDILKRIKIGDFKYHPKN
jgi:hypothetical protein